MITENGSTNPLDLGSIYNGEGAAVRDFNNDRLQDIYFTSNMISNKLYVNEDKFKLPDVTNEAGIDGMSRPARE
ncbi:MAG: hypothetical protein EOP42_00075 [Sphingobacteriaceae bacterium]|nr:MAG: hypothetical protein EOP42_00075 [Sphingobacteriaceae bacterium]